MMASRFTTARAPNIEGGSDGPIKAGLFVMDDEARAALAERRRLAEEERLAQVSRDMIPENETPLQEGARTGMYGVLTREVKNFYPVKLLAKRVGVKQPHPEGPQDASDAGAFVGASAMADLRPVEDPNAWQAKFQHVGPSLASGGEEKVGEAQEEGRGTGAIDGASRREGGMDPILDYVKPSIDIFRAIFASDDEDSEDEDEIKKDETYVQSQALAIVAAPSSVPALDHPAPSNPFDEDVIGPPPPPPPSALSASIDPSSFRPTFKASTTNSRLGDSDSGPSKKEKKKKDKKRAAVLSFADDEEEAELETAREVERKAKVKRRKEASTGDGATAEAVWIEQPTPASAEGTKSRRSAVDFM